MNPLIPLNYFVLLAIPVLAWTTAIAWRSAREVTLPARLAMAAARLLAVCGVLGLVLNVGRWREKVEDMESGWALLADRSASMATRDAGRSGDRSRWDEARDIAREAFAASRRPDRARLYTFAGGVEEARPEALEDLRADGFHTRLVEAGQAMLSLEQGRSSRLRGILLLSDGRQPVPSPAERFALRAAARGAAIYPLLLGGAVPAGDLEIQCLRRRHVSFLGQPVTLQGVLHNTRLGPLQATVTLSDGAARALREQTLFATNGQAVPFSFEIKPEKPGYYEYAIGTPARDGEANRANNSAGLGVFVLTEKLNVLILEGEPYWDTKFLSHLLRGQTNMAVSAVFRVAKDRYFKVTSDTALTAVAADAFPESDEAMARFDLVVVGRGSEYLFDENRARTLERFVRDHGGCLLFARGKSYNGSASPLSDLEPVDWGREAPGGFRLKPLPAGEYAGLFGGLLPERDSPAWNSLPVLERGTRSERLKGFSSVLADGLPAGTEGGAFPALVSRRYGRGLVLLVNGDGLWKWGFYPKAAGPQDVYKNLWIRLFQWAVSFAEFNPGSDFAIQTDRGAARPKEAVRVQVIAKPHAAVQTPSVRLYRGDVFLREAALAPDGERPGVWAGLVSMEEPGLYRLSVETAKGPEAGAQATIQILPPPTEQDELSADGEFMRSLADLSGGRPVTRAEVPDLVKHLEAPESVEQKGNMEWEPAWDKAWAALLLAGCFAAEWYGRRKRGLL